MGRRKGKSENVEKIGRIESDKTLSFESCSPSMTFDMEEAGLESSRKMQDKQETTSKASWTAVTKGKKKRCGGWNRRVKRKGLKSP